MRPSRFQRPLRFERISDAPSQDRNDRPLNEQPHEVNARVVTGGGVMMNAYPAVTSRYAAWLSRNFQADMNGQRGCRITTPFLTPDNDPIIVYLDEQSDKEMKISDRGLVASFLFVSGVDIGDNRQAKRRALFDEMIAEAGLSFAQGEVSVVASQDNLEWGLHNFIRTLQTLTELRLLVHEEEYKPRFVELVKQLLEEHGRRFHYKHKVQGKTLEHTFDFAATRGAPRYASALAATTAPGARDATELLEFKIHDIELVGNGGFTTIAVLDDRYDVWGGRATRVLDGYGIRTLRWAETARIVAEVGDPIDGHR